MRTHITCALLLSVCWTARAHAFDDARLTSVAAELDVRQPEAAKVELLLGLDVRKNWLSSLPLRGLDPDLTLLGVEVADAAPPEVVEGAPGELWLRWPDRRSAPQRGAHSLRLTYQTQQLAADDAARREWALPRWPVNLSGVQVRVIGPTGLQPLPPARENLGEQVERDASSLTFTRVELPRTEPYRVGFAIPQAAPARSNPLAAFRPQALAAQLAAELPQLAAAAAIGLAFACLVLLKRRALRKHDRALLPQL
ncbi:MAG TPA: hypothetical protein VJR89_15400, partial [Polyangiales bacterium]|nr:hypothetical protein [Polyangiales bacterium]